MTPDPDTIQPGAPEEMPADSPPQEAPVQDPGEIEPIQPDIDQPGRGPDEMPPDSFPSPDEMPTPDAMS